MWILNRSVMFKNTSTLVFGTLVSQTITILSMPILSRLYSPSDFGEFAVFLAISSVISVIVTLKYDAAIVVSRSNAEARSLVFLSTMLSLTFGFIFIMIFYFISGLSTIPSKLNFFDNWSILAAFCGMLTALLATGNAWLNRHRYYLRMSILRITQGIAAACFGMVLGLLLFDGGLIFGHVAALFASMVVMVFYFKNVKARWGNFHVLDAAKKNKSYPLFIFPTSLVDVFTLQITIVVISAWFSSETAGFFSMAWKILGVPLSLVGVGLGQVFLRQFSAAWPDITVARTLLIRTWVFLAVFGFFPCTLVVLKGEDLFVWFLGENWAEAGTMAAIIAPMVYAMLISAPTSGTYLVLDLHRYSLVFGVSVLIYRPVCIWLGSISENFYIGLTLLVVLELVQIIIYQLLALKRISRT
jgi:O-antigen/teichoic acid export membrane protein